MIQWEVVLGFVLMTRSIDIPDLNRREHLLVTNTISASQPPQYESRIDCLPLRTLMVYERVGGMTAKETVILLLWVLWELDI